MDCHISRGNKHSLKLVLLGCPIKSTSEYQEIKGKVILKYFYKKFHAVHRYSLVIDNAYKEA